MSLKTPNIGLVSAKLKTLKCLLVTLKAQCNRVHPLLKLIKLEQGPYFNVRIRSLKIMQLGYLLFSVDQAYNQTLSFLVLNLKLNVFSI